MKRAFIVHGWEGYPEEGWFPWLKQELESRGFVVSVPALPHPDAPSIEDWVQTLDSAVGTPDEETYFIGHSIGCQTIMRYLETQPAETKIGGLVFVAGFFTLILESLDDGEGSLEVAKPWLGTPIDTDKVRQMASQITAIFSPTDIFVPLENKELFAQRLGAKVLEADGKGKKGHFSGSDGVLQLPEVLDAVLS